MLVTSDGNTTSNIVAVIPSDGNNNYNKKKATKACKTSNTVTDIPSDGNNNSNKKQTPKA